MCVENITVCPRYLCFGKYSSCSYFSILQTLLNAQVGVLQQQLVSGVVPAEVSEPLQVISSKSDKDEMGLIFFFFFEKCSCSPSLHSFLLLKLFS